MTSNRDLQTWRTEARRRKHHHSADEHTTSTELCGYKLHCDYLLSAFSLKTVVPFHDRPLELVAGPQCPVIEVAAWLAILNKFPRVKNSVVGLKPEVTIRLPLHFRAWTMPDKTHFRPSSEKPNFSGKDVQGCR